MRYCWITIACWSCGLASAAEDIPDDWQPTLTRAAIETSLGLGRTFLLANLKEDGTFNYEYNFVSRKRSSDDNAVRQAGALWGLVRLHQFQPRADTAAALVKAFQAYRRGSLAGPSGGLFPSEPGSTTGRTGTLALLCLALVDFLGTTDEFAAADRPALAEARDLYLKALRSLRRPDGHFYGTYRLETGEGVADPSPYYDGESLLALARAVKHAGLTGIEKDLLASADRMFETYFMAALRRDPDDDRCKAFYQWGSMAFYELATAPWGGLQPHTERTLAMAMWVIDDHMVLMRHGNTAYAYEGLAVAWELARLTGDAAAQRKIGYVIDRGLYTLSTWQIGSPTANAYICDNYHGDPAALGGVLGNRVEPFLRIDVTQHQMHALLLARRFLYP